jgi:two-component system chemotaxis response regulator CheY
MRALIAEGDAAIRLVLREIVEKLRFETVQAGDGHQAKDILDGPELPSLVIIGGGLQGVAALDICRHLRHREDGSHPHVLILTDEQTPAAVKEAMQAGADDCLSLASTSEELEIRLMPAARAAQRWAQVVSARPTVRTQAAHDLLTGLDTRSQVLRRARSELSRACRSESPVAAMLVGVDRIEEINEIYGRRAGDALLCEAARRLAGVIRPYDVAGRYGGAEFLVLAPGCPAEAAESVGERLRQRLVSEPVQADKRVIALTVSVGIAVVVPGRDDDESVLLKPACESLNLARSRGGNRVEVAATAAAAA